LRGFKVGIEDTVRTRKAKLVDEKVKWKEGKKKKEKGLLTYEHALI
jgi:hypothetical protein